MRNSALPLPDFPEHLTDLLTQVLTFSFLMQHLYTLVHHFKEQV
jgi:hypothetical protein